MPTTTSLRAAATIWSSPSSSWTPAGACRRTGHVAPGGRHVHAGEQVSGRAPKALGDVGLHLVDVNIGLGDLKHLPARKQRPLTDTSRQAGQPAHPSGT